MVPVQTQNPRMIKHQIGELHSYEVLESELEILEKEPSLSVELTFSTLLLSVAGSFLIALLTMNNDSSARLFFFIVVLVSSILGLYLLVKWYSTNKREKVDRQKVINGIRERSAPEVVPVEPLVVGVTDKSPELTDD